MAMGQGYWASRRMARRGVLGAGMAGAAAFVAACSSKKDTDVSSSSAPGGAQTAVSGAAAAASEGTPKPGGVIRESTITQAPHFSPFHPGADPSYINFWRREWNYYDSAFRLKDTKEQNKLDLVFATSIEQPDPTTYIVKLRPGAKFHNRAPANGREVTAEDLAATVQFLTKPPASGGTFLQSGKDFKSITVVDPQTLRYETHGPRAFFYENGGLERPFVPKEMLDEQTLKTTIPVGSGPYEYKSHTQGSIEEVKKNEAYWNKDKHYVAERKLTFVPDFAAQEAAFRSNQTDAIDFSNVKQKDQVAKDLGNKITLKSIPSNSGMALMVNMNRAPWNDVRVREAMYRAVDVDRVINTVYFGDAQRTWYYSPGSFLRDPIGFDAVKQYVGQDKKKAADLLKASGIDLNKEYEFMVPVENQSWVDSARLFAEDFAEIGLKTRLNPIVRNIYLQRGGPKPGDFDITMSVLLSYQYARTNSGTFWDSSSLQDPEVDAIIEKIYETVDNAERTKLSHQFETMLAQKYSNLMPMLSDVSHYGWYSYLKGYNDQYLPYRRQIGFWLDK